VLAALLLLGVLACGRENEADVAGIDVTAPPAPERTFTPDPTDPPDPTAAPAPTVTASATDEPTAAPTAEACRNSTDPDCGEFRWDPEPDDNEPLTIEVEYSPKTPRAGDTVTFEVVATDDGGTPVRRTTLFGDGSQVEPKGDACPDQEKRYGPWTPPDPDHQDNEDTFRHTYERSGNFEAIFRYSTDRCDQRGYNPYGSETRIEIKIDVEPDV
jgi:hypothetical protein